MFRFVAVATLLGMSLVSIGCENLQGSVKRRPVEEVAFDNIKMGMTFEEAKPYFDKIMEAFPPLSTWTDRWTDRPEGTPGRLYAFTNGTQKVIIDFDKDKRIVRKEKLRFPQRD